MGQTIAYQQHNHKRCITNALNTAQALCQRNGARLTALRKQVLVMLWQSHKPLGAYELLENMNSGAGAQLRNRRPAPPTVYRALEFLQQQGLIHRIASLNAYIGCTHPSDQHDSHFYICRHCHLTAELIDPPISKAIARCAEEAGFIIEEQAVEVFGICPTCNSSPNDEGKV